MLLSSIKLILLSLFIEIITCFLNGSFIVMITFSLDIPLPLMIFCMLPIFFTWRFRKAFLILRTSLILFPKCDAWAYNLPLFLFPFFELVVLKNLEISLISLVSKLQKVDLAFSYFLILIFIFFWFIFIFLFLELRVRVSDNITQSHDTVTVTVTSHMIHERM